MDIITLDAFWYYYCPITSVATTLFGILANRLRVISITMELSATDTAEVGFVDDGSVVRHKSSISALLRGQK